MPAPCARCAARAWNHWAIQPSGWFSIAN